MDRSRTFGRLLLAGLAGATLGGVAILGFATSLGALVLFVMPLVIALPTVAGCLAELLTAVAARLSGRLSVHATVACAAIPMVALLAALSIAMVIARPGAAGGPLFG